MNIVEKPTSLDTMRKAFVLSPEEQYLLEFTPNVEVLPAETYDVSGNTRYFYVKTYEVGAKHWEEGGHECIDSTGAKRAFHLDALIVHPGKTVVTVDGKTSKRGRPKKGESLVKKEIDPNAPKRQRGRPRKEGPKLVKVIDPNAPKRGRGRPKKNQDSKESFE
jgi:hypothetical protein